jgi:predicted transcriptional regulator
VVKQAPIKVSVETKEKIHYLAALLGRSQARVVDAAVDEYVARHAAELESGLRRAREALLNGPASEIAYLLDEDPEAVARVSGTPASRGRT